MYLTVGPIEHKTSGFGRFRNDDSDIVFGQSAECDIVRQQFSEATEDYYGPLSRWYESPLVRFVELYAEWKQGTKNLSDTDRICTHPSYQAIIGMGPTVLPWIFHLLRTCYALSGK